MTRSSEPTRSARSTSCTASNSAATSPTFSARTAAITSASRARAAPPAAAARSASSTRGSLRVRVSTSREKTTAAAGAPPITEAHEPSTASTVMPSLSACEKTTNAPPW